MTGCDCEIVVQSRFLQVQDVLKSVIPGGSSQGQVLASPGIRISPKKDRNVMLPANNK